MNELIKMEIIMTVQVVVILSTYSFMVLATQKIYVKNGSKDKALITNPIMIFILNGNKWFDWTGVMPNITKFDWIF